MQLRIVPPKESITPRRKQLFYDFSNQVLEYGSELLKVKESEEFESLSEEEKAVVNKDLEIVYQLNNFQVSEVKNF